jgi:tetratricopeptide (TPR) repeat protein
VNWFRSESVPPPRPTVAAGTLPLPENSPATLPTVPAPVPKPRPPKPEVAHYASRSPAELPAGNRADAEVQFAAAVAAHDRRDLPTAIALYQRTVELDPSYFSAHYNLGLAALDSGDISRALFAGECATRLNPRSTAARRLFASALQRGNYPAEAAEQLERVVAAEPADASSHLALAGLYARSLGEPEKARPHYERVLALDPQNAQAGAIRVWLAENP